jgi:hypothetical protein
LAEGKVISVGDESSSLDGKKTISTGDESIHLRKEK